MKRLRSWLQNLTTNPFKPKPPRRYPPQPYIPAPVGYLAQAIAYFTRSGDTTTATAWTHFTTSLFDADKVVPALAAPRILGQGFTPEQDYAHGCRYLKFAGVELYRQQRRHGEDNFGLFVEEVRGMRRRGRDVFDGCEGLRGELWEVLKKVRGGDEGVIREVVGEMRGRLRDEDLEDEG